MKTYQCPNCKRKVEVEADTVMIICGCGYEMVEQTIGNKKETKTKWKITKNMWKKNYGENLKKCVKTIVWISIVVVVF